jgi:cation transport protein ChaC
VSEKEPHRIFAYGSLMWRPDFEFLSARPARLFGYHRRLCVISHHYRGTPETPGLVLGLDRGGSCIGLLYEIEAGHWPETIAKVRKREMLRDVYREAVVECVDLKRGRKRQAVAYVARRESDTYAAPMDDTKLLGFINQGHGTMGSCRAYVASTLKHLRALGVHDAGLERLAPHVLDEASHK